MRRISLTTLLLAATVLLTAEGCGGSNGGGGGNPPGNPFAGTYEGTANLDNGKIGTLGFEVQANGVAVGFLTVPEPPNMAPTGLADEFPPSVYDISGTVTSSGFLAMTGDITGGTFAVEGTLTANGSAPITIAMVNGATTYTGTVDQQSDGPGANVTMTLITAGNAHLNLYSQGSLLAELTDEGEYDDLVITESEGMFTDSRTFSIEIPDTMQPGQVQVITNPLQQPMIMYSEFTWADPVIKTWTATSGSFTLVSRNGNKVSLILTDVVIAPTPVGGNHGTGSFKASGTIHN